MDENKYDEASVQELLAWTREKLSTKDYPAEPYMLNSCTTIKDAKHYLELTIILIEQNWSNPTFHPAIDQLRTYRKKWEESKQE